MTRSTSELSDHPLWEQGTTWKSVLNNLRLIIQPYTFYHLMRPWLEVFNISKFRTAKQLHRCFLRLIEEMNQFLGLFSLCFAGLSPFRLRVA